jgi:putative RecB family exonuclease
MSTDLLTRDQLAGRQGGVWAYISPSRLGKWLSCPLAFKIQYVDGIRSPTTPALFLGKVVHANLETYYRHRQLGVILGATDVLRRQSESWSETAEKEGMKFQSGDNEEALKKQAMDLVATYLAQIPADEPRPLAVEVAVEAPLVPFSATARSLQAAGG